MHAALIPLSCSQALVHRKVFGRAIGGGAKIYVDAKACAFANLASEDLLDSADVCRLFPCSPRTLYRWMAEAQLRHAGQVGRQYLFTKAELLRWWSERPSVGRPRLASRTHPAAAGVRRG